jgi:hypothetical protein
MAKPGRKPVVGERYASGRIKPPHLRDVQVPSPAAIKRTMEAALRAAGDPRWASMVGRLRLCRDLTERQFNAAEAYGRLRGRFDRMMGMPRRSARSCLYDIEAGRTPQEMSEAAMMALREEHGAMLSGVEGGLGVARVAITAGGARRVLDGAVAQRAHQARAGRTVAMLDRIVLDDEAPLPGELPLLTAALDVLVVLFRIGERP